MGGGSKGGGGGHTPIEQPNTLESAQRLKIIDLLCEGVAGQDVTFKNIYLDNTPIQNSDGTYNFTGIRVSALPGTHNQDYLAGFDSTDKIVSVGTEVKAATPITRTITDPLVDSVRVTLALGSLVTMTDKGDRVGGSVSLTVMCGNKSYPVTISGKTTSAYHQDVVLTDLPDAPFNISVQRNTPDSTTDKTSNATHWVSYVESIDAKFSYPNSVVVGLEIDSAQFGGKIPTRTYRNKWTQIKVPNNYDPITRTYEGVWLGEFKTAWSDNPAWVFYDLVTDKRYGLGDRLGEFGCDKWSLYQIAKYCDQIVPDGFGGQEPRFTCNAYLSEPRDAKALLDDLASVFRGIAVWDGEMVTALQDAKKDPTATYSNANVVDGMFAYSGAAQKTIFTAVHVKYNDKTDNFATKTEYVANDEAIKRYGLNVKQITAFGCTSRGQAARVGKWLIETSIRERQMVSFSVGREGIRHLPFDIIEIADNDYAGDMIGGRVLSVMGNTITVDRSMSNVSSIRYYANGQSKTVNVTAVQDNKITLSAKPVGIEQLGVFSATKTDVKPRLFRALSIAEDDGTYTISAVQHDENKEAIVDQGATFEQDDTATKHKPQVSYGTVSKDGDNLVISWEGTNAVQYLIKIYKDGKLYNSYTQDTAEIKLKGLSNGNYRAEIRGKSANGELTEAVIKEWSIDYDIKGLKDTPELFAIKLDWTNPTTVINKAKIEIYRSQAADRATASKMATLSYPTDTFTQNGVKLTETHHFWLRLIDDQGNTGNWVTISGQCSSDTSQIVASINGQITETELAQSLIDSLQNDIDTARNQTIGSAGVDAANKVAAEGIKRAQALQAEATARGLALQAEANARTQAIAAQDTKQTNALIAKANEFGTKITEVSGVNDQQAQKLTTITAKQGELTSGLEIERTARIAGDTAEANARQTLASQVGGNKTSITDLQSTKASKTEVSSLARTALQSEWTDYADDKVDGLEVGGRNLLRGTAFSTAPERYYSTVQVNKGTPNSVAVTSTGMTTAGVITDRLTDIKNGQKYTLSFELRTEDIDFLSYNYLMDTDEGNSSVVPSFTLNMDGQWHTYIVTFTSDINRSQCGLMLGTIGTRVGTFEIRRLKLEKGNKATDWTPAPEDVAADIDVVSSELTSFKQTTASKDQAQTIVNNQALSRIGDAEGKITTLQSTKASKTEVSSLARTALQSEWKDYADDKVDNLEIGGRNLLLNSDFTEGYEVWGNSTVNSFNHELGFGYRVGGRAIGDRYGIMTKAEFMKTGLIEGHTYTLSFYGQGTNSVMSYVYLMRDGESNYRLPSILLGSGFSKHCYITFTAPFTANNVGVLLATDANREDGNNWFAFTGLKIEKGNKATEWSPAPEDVDAAITTVSSDLTSFKQTTASKDQAQTIVNNQALSRINDAEGKITTLQSTKASKTEVSSLARTALQSEWKDYANDKVDNLEIGGKNLLPNSDFSKGFAKWNFENTFVAQSETYGLGLYTSVKNKGDTTNTFGVFSDTAYRTAQIYKDETYTLSWLGQGTFDGLNYIHLLSSKMGNHRLPFVPLKVGRGNKYEITFIAPYTTDDLSILMGAVGKPYDAWFSFSRLMLQKGNKATEWSPAPEDLAEDINIVSSDLTSFKQTTASKDQAQTIVNNQALSRINDAEGKITTLQNTSVTKNQAQSTHTIKTQAIAGGKRALAGIAVGAMANETTAESQVIVMADKFGVVKNASDGVVKPMLTVVNNQVAVNGDLIADGTILGKHIKANQTLSAPVINGGSLNINNRFKVDKFGNTTIQSSAGNTGLKITDEKIEAYDAAGRLRVRLGKLS
ncbi:TipJ family phage tail tip protein [Psychrobacter celer]|uniref:TipJ family phage tail tip protein n=1 Tax=Psychrobacter celer TaxID=306572 RepID=UPI003FD47415